VLSILNLFKKPDITKRQKYNRELLKIISKEVEAHPELRFIQLLWDLGIVSAEDRFYEESDETLSRIRKDDPHE